MIVTRVMSICKLEVDICKEWSLFEGLV